MCGCGFRLVCNSRSNLFYMIVCYWGMVSFFFIAFTRFVTRLLSFVVEVGLFFFVKCLCKSELIFLCVLMRFDSKFVNVCWVSRSAFRSFCFVSAFFGEFEIEGWVFLLFNIIICVLVSNMVNWLLFIVSSLFGFLFVCLCGLFVFTDSNFLYVYFWIRLRNMFILCMMFCSIVVWFFVDMMFVCLFLFNFVVLSWCCSEWIFLFNIFFFFRDVILKLENFFFVVVVVVCVFFKYFFVVLSFFLRDCIFLFVVFSVLMVVVVVVSFFSIVRRRGLYGFVLFLGDDRIVFGFVIIFGVIVFILCIDVDFGVIVIFFFFAFVSIVFVVVVVSARRSVRLYVFNCMNCFKVLFFVYVLFVSIFYN